MTRDPSNTNLPPWLRGQPLPPRPASGNAAFHNQPSSGGTEDTSNLPAWLREDNQPTASSANNQSLPDWLREADPSDSSWQAVERETPPAFSGSDWSPGTPTSDEPVPDWLQGLAEETGANKPETPTSDEPVPDWLQSIANEPPAAKQEETVPDWLREQVGEPSPSASVNLWDDEPTQTPPPAESNVPSWLSSADETTSSPPTSESNVPSWLGGADETTSSPPTAESNVPSWLGGADETTSSPVPTSENSDLPLNDVPDWLRDIPDERVREAMAEDDELPSERFSFGDLGEDTTSKSPSGPPAWLGDASETSTSDWFGAPASSSPSTQDLGGTTRNLDNDDAPAWLGAIDEPADQPPASESNAPSWLSGAGEPVSQPPASESNVPAWLSGADEPISSSPTPADDNIPSWLSGAGEPVSQPPASESNVPAWLSGADEPISSSPTPADNNIPSWLSGADEPVSQPPASESNIPSWLGVADEPVSPPPSVADDNEVPSWLRENAANEPEKPAWMRDAGPEKEQPHEAPSSPVWSAAGTPSNEAPIAPPTAEDVPDWLRSATTATPPPADNDLPNWLRSEASESAPVAPPATPNDTNDLPPWLRDERGAALPTATGPGEQELPPWLKGAAADTSVTTNLQPPADVPPVAEPITSASSLDWFDSAEPQAAPTQESDNGFLGGTDLPVWLRQPETRPAATPTTESRSLDWLNRLSGGDEEEPSNIETTVTRLTPPPNPVKSSQQIQTIALLEQLAATPIKATPTTTAIAETQRRRFGLDQMLYLLLLVAVVVATLAPSLVAPLQVPMKEPAAQALYEKISALGPNDVVLISYDWDARRVAELRSLENQVIGQLIAQKVKLVLMSTDPQGSLLLYDLRDTLRNNGYSQYGDDYLLLGYKPGGELALRSLAQNLGQSFQRDFNNQDVSTSNLVTGQTTGKPLTSLSDFSMIMLLADDQVDVQSWMEQVQRVVQQVPFSILLTAEAAPSAQPYLRQPNVFGLASTSGALAYGALRSPNDPTIAAQSGQLRASLAAFVLLLVVGAIVVASSTAVRRRRA